MSNFKPLPVYIKKYNAGIECDMAIGPCSCGAWHTEEEYKKFLSGIDTHE